MLVTMSPSVPVCWRRNDRATPDGRYPSSAIAACTRSRAAGLTRGEPCRTRLTVAEETPDRAATSVIVVGMRLTLRAGRRCNRYHLDVSSGLHDIPVSTTEGPLDRARKGDPMTNPTDVVLVPHTHWDREWYLPFQVFRVRLVEMIDRAHAEDLEGEIPLTVPVGVWDEHDVGGVGHWISLPRSIERSLCGRDRNIMESTAYVQMVSITPPTCTKSQAHAHHDHRCRRPVRGLLSHGQPGPAGLAAGQPRRPRTGAGSDRRAGVPPVGSGSVVAPPANRDARTHRDQHQQPVLPGDRPRCGGCRPADGSLHHPLQRGRGPGT